MNNGYVTLTQQALLATVAAVFFTANLPGWQPLQAPTLVASISRIGHIAAWHARDQPEPSKFSPPEIQTS